MRLYSACGEHKANLLASPNGRGSEACHRNHGGDPSQPAHADGGRSVWRAAGKPTHGQPDCCGSGGGVALNFFGLWNFTAPPTSSWSADNCGTCTITSTSVEQYLHSTAVGTTAQQFHAEYRTAPSTPYIITATMFHDTSGISAANSSSNNASYGIGFRDGTGKLEVFQFITFSSGCEVTVSKWTNSTTPSSNPFSGSASISNCDPVLKQPTVMQIQDDGTTIYFQTSIDGVNFYTLYSESRTSFFGSGPTQVLYGFYAVSVAAQSVDIGLVSWYVH
jgi:hypothetical protein